VIERSTFRYVGPGIIWAMSAIGQTHVVLSTYAGARFGFDLLWMVVLAHALTYPVFEYGARYAIATGHSLNHAYLQMRGMRWVVVPFFGVMLVTLAFLIVASLGSVTASILLAAFPSVGFKAWVVVITLGTALLLYGGHYQWLERLNLVMAAVLLLGVAVAFSLQPPGIGSVAAGLVPAIPAGGLITLVALMRLPSDAGTSVFLSTWALRCREAVPSDTPAVAMRGILFGLRCGYALSLVVSIAFLSLGATVLRPRGVDLEGIDLALQLSQMFTATVGAWTFPLFIVIAFVALFSGYYAVADGVPRMFDDLAARLRGHEPAEGMSRQRAVYTALILGGGLAIAVGVERPAFLVVLAVSVGLIGFPLIYGLNLFAVTRMIAPEFRPHPANVAIACAGLLFSITGTALLFVTRVLD
jgi:Mn2+/Fe2+ NRAMP family transporter